MKKFLFLLLFFISINNVYASTIDTYRLSENSVSNYSQHTAGFYKFNEDNVTISKNSIYYKNIYVSNVNLSPTDYDYFTFNAFTNMAINTSQSPDFDYNSNGFATSISYFYYDTSYVEVACDMSSVNSGFFVKCPIPNKDHNISLNRIHLSITPPPAGASFVNLSYGISDFINFISTSEKDISDIKQNTEDTNKAVNETNDTLKDDNVDSSDDTLNNISSSVATNNVISDLLLLPVTLYQKIINSLNGGCSSFNLGSIYGHNLTLPCINLQNYLGSSIFTTIDLIISGLFVLVIRKKFVDIFNNMTNLKNGGNEIE